MTRKIAISELLNIDEVNSKKILKPLRKRIGPQQLFELQALFDKGLKFPNKFQREQLGEKLGLTARTIQVWFQNRRQNMKCSGNKDDDQIAYILQSLSSALK